MDLQLLTRSVASPLKAGFQCPMDKLRLVKLYAPIHTRVETLPEAVLLQESSWLLPWLIANANGLRITEVLNMRTGDISNKGRVIIRPLKGSSVRAIFIDPNAIDRELLASCTGLERVFNVNYDQVYKGAKRLNLGTKYDGYIRERVTHAGRHELFNDAMRVSGSSDCGAVIGHKSKKAGTWYDKTANLEADRQRKRRSRAKIREDIETHYQCGDKVIPGKQTTR